MHKTNPDPKLDRADNKADVKDSQQNRSSILEEPQMLNSLKAADYPPSLNGVTKNET
ncbi:MULTISPECIES: hypothetical protein [Paenibacillus]|uniref:hypothetical protein n=1 Tax=Paenibacillus TaxID=44249 RepID=UPI00168A8C86|nr:MULTISPECIES: hypothetical protein [Paenibacillus]